MLDRLTDHAKQVMYLSNQLARDLNHESLGTGHLLLGLVESGEGVATGVLADTGVELQRVRPEIEKLIEPGSSPVQEGFLPFTPRTKRVLEHSMTSASRLGHESVGTTHLLVGLIREQDGIAIRVLNDLGIDLEKARAQALECLSGDLD